MTFAIGVGLFGAIAKISSFTFLHSLLSDISHN